MRVKTEEFLYLLLWTADTFAWPSFRTVGETFEGWAYRKGLLRQLHRLERRRLLESQDNCGERIHRLTDAGRLHAIGGRDPEVCWKRAWDGVWRIVLFDVPERRRAMRQKLRRYLRARGFGCLQNSAWITPDPFTEQRVMLADGPVNVEKLILLDARAAAGESDSEIVVGAWNWKVIGQRYSKYCDLLARKPRTSEGSAEQGKAFQLWLRKEREAWIHAVAIDPLLPKSLLPGEYLGTKAAALRRESMRQSAKSLNRSDC